MYSRAIIDDHVQARQLTQVHRIIVSFVSHFRRTVQSPSRLCVSDEEFHRQVSDDKPFELLENRRFRYVSLSGHERMFPAELMRYRIWTSRSPCFPAWTCATSK